MRIEFKVIRITLVQLLLQIKALEFPKILNPTMDPFILMRAKLQVRKLFELMC